MTPQKLKNSLLWMAVQGKLSIQGHDETVTFDSDTWEINEEESFTIPENWVWKRFGFFGDLRMGKTILKSDLYDKGIPVYSATQSDDVLGYIKEAELELHKDDLVIPARGNSIGYVTLVRDEIATCTQTTICVRDIHDIYPEYLYWCCYAFKEKWFVFSGSAIPQVTVKQISQFMVPTPPIAEQKRIVAKIEELLPYIDRYEQAWSKLEEFNKRFPVDMQKSILQMAIQGKLVPQLPEEGTGEELFQQIRAEKQALIKAGKIKKEKPLPEITEDELPFDIPENWKWVQFGTLYSLSNGTASRGSKDGSEHPVLRLADLSNNVVDTNKIRKIKLTDKEFASHMVQEDDLIFIRVNGSKDRVATAFRYTAKDTISYCDHLFCGHKCSALVDADFIMFIFNCPSMRRQLLPEIKTTAGQNTISKSSMAKILLPLPPLAEQKRIVAKLEEILPLCERLK